jgi:hypothetical protein
MAARVQIQYVAVELAQLCRTLQEGHQRRHPYRYDTLRLSWHILVTP